MKARWLLPLALVGICVVADSAYASTRDAIEPGTEQQDQYASQFTLSIANGGGSASNLPVELLRKDAPPIVLGRTNDGGIVNVMDIANLPKQQMEVFACEDDYGNQVVFVIQAGVDPGQDPRCRKRRRVGAIMWGENSAIDLGGGAPGVAQGGAPEMPGESRHRFWGFDDGLPPIGFQIEGYGGLSSLLSPDLSCAQATSPFGGLGSCSANSRTGSWGVSGGIRITPFFVAEVGYQEIRALSTSASFNDGTFSLVDSTTLGPIKQFQVVGIGRLPFGRFAVYGEVGAARWSAVAAGTLTSTDSSGTMNTTSASDSNNAWNPLFGFGVEVSATQHLFFRVGYQHLTVDNYASSTTTTPIITTNPYGMTTTTTTVNAYNNINRRYWAARFGAGVRF